MARVGVLLLLLLCAVTSFVAAQDIPSSAVQTPGVLDRLMQDYVYPMREYDWAGAIRRLLDSAMNYITIESKEPKSGHMAQDRAAIVVRRMLARAAHYVDSFLA